MDSFREKGEDVCGPDEVRVIHTRACMLQWKFYFAGVYMKDTVEYTMSSGILLMIVYATYIRYIFKWRKWSR